jgi:hypothetical protein
MLNMKITMLCKGDGVEAGVRVGIWFLGLY